MINQFDQRKKQLRTQMCEQGIDIALITDDDSIYYFTGYYDYLHMEFGRPTILVIHSEDESLLITPSIDYNTAIDHAKVDRIEAWNDGVGTEWREHLSSVAATGIRVAIEPDQMPPTVRNYIDELTDHKFLGDIQQVIAEMRMIKSSEELQLARFAGQVAVAMMQAGKDAIGQGVAEFEVALATSEAGTREAASLLATHYPGSPMSPNTHFLQIMASGPEITRTHHRASNRVMQIGEPVFLCFCGMTNFHRFKLGFDRTFWIGEITEKSQEQIYWVAMESQKAALAELKPGAVAQDVHAAYAEVIQTAGYDFPFRCGRGTGFSFLEKPQLVSGDKTELKPGMVLAVDGSVSTPNFRAQVGDSFVVTEQGYEQLTPFSKSLEDIVL